MVMGFPDGSGTVSYTHLDVYKRQVSSFRNGRAVVCIVSGGALKYGSIDRNGREILPCIYDWVQHTPFGTTWVGEGEDFASRACTLLDVSGKPLIDYKAVSYTHLSDRCRNRAGQTLFRVECE